MGKGGSGSHFQTVGVCNTRSTHHLTSLDRKEKIWENHGLKFSPTRVTFFSSEGKQCSEQQLLDVLQVESWDNLLICWAWPQKHNQRTEETNEVAFIEFLFPISNCYTRSLHSHSNSYMLRNDMPKEVGKCEKKTTSSHVQNRCCEKWLTGAAADLLKIYSSYEDYIKESTIYRSYLIVYKYRLIFFSFSCRKPCGIILSVCLVFPLCFYSLSSLACQAYLDWLPITVSKWRPLKLNFFRTL